MNKENKELIVVKTTVFDKIKKFFKIVFTNVALYAIITLLCIAHDQFLSWLCGECSL